MNLAVAERPDHVARRMRKLVPAALCLGLVLVGVLPGCGGGDRRAPVEDRGGPGQHYSRVYLVQRGDTMYSIAFRYGLDYRRLAAANGLAAPYTIYPGQKLQLREADIPPPRVAARAPAPVKPAPRPASTVKTSPSRPATPAPAANTTVTKSSSSAGHSSGASDSPRGEPAWRWPSTGRVTRGYSSTVHKGIDIDGRKGDAVYAVAGGKVVYAGTGIVGFGELLIIKHNELYLSAYGHNSRLLVAEGATVKSGDRIALKGDTGTDKVKLHFEIRRAGKPVDPQKLLPGR